jgi:ankyrin repeat protein
VPVKSLPSNPNLDHLRYQAKDLLSAHAARDPQVAQRIREFHPRFQRAPDAAIFETGLSLGDAQLTIARERGFESWARLKRHIEKPTLADKLSLPHHERIEDVTFRRAVDLLDEGNVAGLSAWLVEHPNLVHQHVLFEGGNYFRNPTLLEFVAENPLRHGTLPANVVEVARVILDAGADQDLSALNQTLELVCSGRVPRECRVQRALIDLLCDRGADPNGAMSAALGHAEFEAVNALIARGAQVDLKAAAGLGRIEDARRLLATASSDERHRALALASQFGHTGIVRLLLDAGEDPNRYNPVGFHAHSTPLHQAACGHGETVRLLVERGARLDAKDTMWQATPAEWANHEGQTQIEQYLLALEKKAASTD